MYANDPMLKIDTKSFLKKSIFAQKYFFRDNKTIEQTEFGYP